MFGNQLRESNQNSNLDRHLSVILHSVSEKESGEVYQNQLNVQEKVGIFEQDKLDPIQAKRNDIWKSGCDHDKLDSLDSTPQPF